jgi:hypothetical protein
LVNCAPDYLISAGVSEEDAPYATLGIGGVMVLMAIVTIPLMDRSETHQFY